MYATPKRLLRSNLIFLAAVLVAMTFSQSGRAQSGCVIDQGQDPLDVLNTLTVRHRLWILQDITGSMDADFGDVDRDVPGGDSASENRIEAAVFLLRRFVQNAKDAAGNPLVNLSYSVFGGCTPDANDECDSCDIGATLEIKPAACGNDSTQAVYDRIKVERRHRTPIGMALKQTSLEISDFIRGAPKVAGQKDFILLVTDGEENCIDSGYIDGMIKFDSLDPTKWEQADSESDYRTIRAGLEGRDALSRIDSQLLDGSRGDIFTIGMGLSNDGRRRTNHIAWQASNDRRGAIFANNPTQFDEALKAVLNQIALPATTVSLTGQVVGTVKELVQGEVPVERNGASVYGTDSTVRVADVDVTFVDNPSDAQRQGNLTAAMKSRRAVSRNRNNVLLRTQTEYPGFRTHLYAQKAFNTVPVLDGSGNPMLDGNGDSVTKRVPGSFETFWDAGEKLQELRPQDRNIFFDGGNGARKGKLIPFRVDRDPNRGVTPRQLGVGPRFLDELDPAVNGGANTPEDAAKMVEFVIRGYRLSVHKDTGTFYTPGGALNVSEKECDEPACANTWKLRDATHAGPSLSINPARSPDDAPPDPPNQPVAKSYSEFFWKKYNRLSVAWLSTNGGMIHGFRADTGVEVFAYVPSDVIPKLADLVRVLVSKNSNTRDHVYTASGACTVEDVFLRRGVKLENPGFIPDDDWHTVLACGRGPGGKALTALDITDLPDWSPGQPVKINANDDENVKVLFNRQSGDVYSRDAAPLDGLGQTWSTPALGHVNVNRGTPARAEPQAVLFAGSGYGCRGTSEGKFFYVFRLEDGAVLARYGDPRDPRSYASQPIPQNPQGAIKDNVLAAPPTPFNPHFYDPSGTNKTDYVTRVFVPDLLGNVFKLDTSSPDLSRWRWSLFYAFATNPNPLVARDQPIAAPVALLYRPNAPGPYVFAGAGNDTRITKTDDARFYMVGIKDDEPMGDTSVPPTRAQEITVQAGSDLLPAGGPFILPLGFGERVYTGPTTTADSGSGAGGSVFFSASRSGDLSADCQSSFVSSLYGFYANTGLGIFPEDLSQSSSRRDLESGKITTAYARDGRLYVGLSGGFGLEGRLARVYGPATLPPDLFQGPGGGLRSGTQIRVERITESVF